MSPTGEFGTFSVVARDADRQSWGVAVATKPRSVGAFVPWGEWRVGALATQADTNYSYGPRGLELLRQGRSAEEVVHRLTRADARREHRQLGVVDRRGRSAAWTGAKCLDAALHESGDGFTCQGNLLASSAVVTEMARTFRASRGPLASRMVQTLKAGAKQGGDRRGIQSAALLVVHHEPGLPMAWGDRWCDVRVDLHARPIAELERIVRIDQAETARFLARRAQEKGRRRGR